MTVVAVDVGTRPAAPDDEQFLEAVYASTRVDEFAALSLAPQELAALLRMQFLARRSDYLARHPHARLDLVLVGEEPVGDLFVDHADDEIRVLDIAVLPAWRNRGIGTAVLRELIDRSTAVGRPLTLHVGSTNPARRLYERLGFRVVACSDNLLRLERSPGDGDDAVQ